MKKSKCYFHTRLLLTCIWAVKGRFRGTLNCLSQRNYLVPLPRIKLGTPPYQEGSLSLAYKGDIVFMLRVQQHHDLHHVVSYLCYH